MWIHHPPGYINCVRSLTYVLISSVWLLSQTWNIHKYWHWRTVDNINQALFLLDTIFWKIQHLQYPLISNTKTEMLRDHLFFIRTPPEIGGGGSTGFFWRPPKFPLEKSMTPPNFRLRNRRPPLISVSEIETGGGVRIKNERSLSMICVINLCG